MLGPNGTGIAGRFFGSLLYMLSKRTAILNNFS
jgi:hypothetical protein